MSLIGSMIIVLSSLAFYANVLLWVTSDDSSNKQWWLHPAVLGYNVFSVFQDIGLFMVR